MARERERCEERAGDDARRRERQEPRGLEHEGVEKDPSQGHHRECDGECAHPGDDRFRAMPLEKRREAAGPREREPSFERFPFHESKLVAPRGAALMPVKGGASTPMCWCDLI